MGSSVQFENTYAEDLRWIEAGADAFALHFAACCYADRHNTDGKVPKVMVPRVALAVQPDAVEAAVAALLKVGFWTSSGNSYQVVRYVEDKIGLAAEEKIMNRERWAEDKRWRRRHNAGNHSICPPEKCREASRGAGVSQADSKETPRKSPAGVQEESYRTTRPDSLRPDSTRLDYGVGEEGESGWRPSGPASAGATASPGTAGKARSRRPREESTEERLARADAIVAELNWEPETDDPEGLAGLVDAAPAVSSRGHG